MSTDLARVKAAQLDGTSQNPRLRQKQLIQIHGALLAEAQALHAALRRDLEYTKAEADIEVYLAISDTRQHYESLNFEQELEQEYQVAQGKDNAQRRTAAGTVYIEQAKHSPLYSVIAPLTAAILAGNCVVVEFLKTTLSVNGIVRSILSDSIKNGSVAITSTRVTDTGFTSNCVLVSPKGSTDLRPWSKQIRFHNGRTIAIVDRTADVEQAAQAIVTASFSFGGRSPYSPSLVLVNEFVEEGFERAVVQCSAKLTASQPHRSKDDEYSRVESVYRKAVESGDASMVVSNSTTMVVKVSNRKSDLLNLQSTTPFLLIHSVTSLDDAIDVANKGNPLLACYLFSSPTNARYLSQFIDSRLSCVNHIPTELLVGPSAPTDYPISLSTRFTRTTFETPSPVLVSQTSTSTLLQATLLGDKREKSLREVHAKMKHPLTPIGQKPGGSIGFFEQGIIVGGVIYGSILIGTLYTVGRYGVLPFVQQYRK